MGSVSMQIQGAINETINRQVSPEIKAALRYNNAQPPQMGWNLPGERPERKSENVFNRNIRSSSGDELLRNLNCNEDEEDTHYKRFVASLIIRYFTFNAIFCSKILKFMLSCKSFEDEITLEYSLLYSKCR